MELAQGGSTQGSPAGRRRPSAIETAEELRSHAGRGHFWRKRRARVPTRTSAQVSFARVAREDLSAGAPAGRQVGRW
eukprot:13270065-Alexandrium_andersonii.AAC.1